MLFSDPLDYIKAYYLSISTIPEGPTRWRTPSSATSGRATCLRCPKTGQRLGSASARRQLYTRGLEVVTMPEPAT